jgi:hypothetical protein
VTVGDQKEGFITLSLDEGHKPAQLIEGKEPDLLDALGNTPTPIRDFAWFGGLLRFSSLHGFLGHCELHAVQSAFTFARCSAFWKGRILWHPLKAGGSFNRAGQGREFYKIRNLFNFRCKCESGKDALW